MRCRGKRFLPPRTPDETPSLDAPPLGPMPLRCGRPRPEPSLEPAPGFGFVGVIRAGAAWLTPTPPPLPRTTPLVHGLFPPTRLQPPEEPMGEIFVAPSRLPPEEPKPSADIWPCGAPSCSSAACPRPARAAWPAGCSPRRPASSSSTWRAAASARFACGTSASTLWRRRCGCSAALRRSTRCCGASRETSSSPRCAPSLRQPSRG